MDEYSAYLGFARGLTRRFAERVIGRDESASRIVKARVPDHILGGFLTPVRLREEFDENGPIDDLPQDSAFEQTSLGVEWLAPISELADAKAVVRIGMSVYVRALPTYEEQARGLSWKEWRVRSQSESPREPQAEIIAVWSRVDLEPSTVEVDLGELSRRRKLTMALAPAIQQAWTRASLSIAKRYPTLSLLSIRQSEFTQETFEAWCDAIRPTPKNDDWTADLDIRLTPIPSEPGCGRISVRIINRTPPRDVRTSGFFDPNLYAVHFEVVIPKQAHRDRTFRELEQSYRYDLSLPAVGLNCHAEVERRGGDVILRTNAVPVKEQGRLEPRTLKSASPTFDALSADPAPVLRRILGEMRSW